MRTREHLWTAVRLTLVLTLLLGVGYPLAVTLLARVIFPAQAKGRLLERDGRIIGSALIGQRFVRPEYFHGRPSAAGIGYDAANSAGTNLGPTNRKLIDKVKAAVDAARRDNPDGCGTPCGGIPADLVTASASGLDPHISPDAAFFQVARIARVRGVSDADVRKLVAASIEPRQLGFLGEPRVNVLLLNLALDDRFGADYSSVKR